MSLGYSINLLTLLAMVLAIGLVVDDAIVVLENIHRHIEEGRKPVDAAIVGMREIFGPIVSMTITLAAVYAPIGFTKGLTGALFREFAFTLAGAVVISGIVAVTLSPMMSSKLLKPHGEKRGFAAVVDRIFTRLENWYGRRLSGSLDYRGVTLVIVAVMLATTAFMFTRTRPSSPRKRTRARTSASSRRRAMRPPSTPRSSRPVSLAPPRQSPRSTTPS